MANKFHAQRTYSELSQRDYASKAEAKRGDELYLLLRARQISNLQHQPQFVLCQKPKITYRADFQYVEDGQTIVEDVKGVLQRETRVKLAWVKEKFGVDVRLIK